MGCKFVIETDHKSLKELVSQTVQTPEQQQWLKKLIGFDFTIVYKPSTENGLVDGLSRIEEATLHSLQAVSHPIVAILDALRLFLQTDSTSQDLIHKVQYVPQDHANFSYRDGLLFYKNRIWLPPKAAFIPLIIVEYHTTPLVGSCRHPVNTCSPYTPVL